jgi:hypothetical protein
MKKKTNSKNPKIKYETPKNPDVIKNSSMFMTEEQFLTDIG